MKPIEIYIKQKIVVKSQNHKKKSTHIFKIPAQGYSQQQQRSNKIGEK